MRKQGKSSDHKCIETGHGNGSALRFNWILGRSWTTIYLVVHFRVLLKRETGLFQNWSQGGVRAYGDCDESGPWCYKSCKFQTPLSK